MNEQKHQQNIINGERVINFIETEIIGEIAIELVDGLDVIQNKIDDIETSLQNDLPETVKNMLNDELTALQEKYNNTIVEYRNHLVYDILRYAMMDLHITGNISAKSAKSAKSANGEKSAYTVKMAIMDNITTEWQKLADILKSIETADKLPSIHTNDGWKRTISAAMPDFIKSGAIERNDNHEYRLRSILN